MREYVKIYCCGDCIHYNLKKHKCNRGANIEGKATEHFYRDCPIGIHKEIDSGDFEGMDRTDLLNWLIKDVYKDDRNALIEQLESLEEDVANNEQTN